MVWHQDWQVTGIIRDTSMGPSRGTDLDAAFDGFIPSFHRIVADLSKQKKKMLVTMHRYLDGDAFGSAIAFGLMLRQMGIDSSLLCVPFVPEKFDFLSRMSRLTIFEASQNKRLFAQDNYTLAMGAHFPEESPEYGGLAILDCAGFGQVPREAWAVGNSFRHKVHIDHHTGHSFGPDRGKAASLVCSCSSTSEILYHLMERLGLSSDPEVAVSLYVGANADLRKNDIQAGHPAYPAYVMDALKQRLNALGRDIWHQIDSIFSLDPWEQSLLDTVGSALRFSGSIVYAAFDPSMVLTAKRETDALDNPRMPFHEFHIRLRQLMGQYGDTHPVAALFDQILGKVSLFDLRRNQGYDLAGISRELGGGGHRNRAGFAFETARDTLLDLNLISGDTPDSTVIETVIEFVRTRLAATGDQ